jgi:hypothetical protein
MTAGQQAGQVLGRTAKRTADHPLVRLTGRVGLVAYGAVHLLIAVLAVRVATGEGGEPGKSGALATIAEQPAGRTLLWVTAVGLAALVVWEVTEAVYGYRYVRPPRRRWMRRLASAAEAVVFGALAWSAAKIAKGGKAESSEQQEATTAKILDLPGGQFLVGAAGLAVLVAAGFLVRRGLRASFVSDLDLSGVDQEARRLAVRLGQAGWTALGVAYGIVGFLLVVAAVRYDPSRATGLDTALHTLAAQPYGTILLAVLAAGLGCFGVYCLVDARYRRT